MVMGVSYVINIVKATITLRKIFKTQNVKKRNWRHFARKSQKRHKTQKKERKKKLAARTQ
jgi:hypothetical protein